jgi:hypothetical protein
MKATTGFAASLARDEYPVAVAFAGGVVGGRRGQDLLGKRDDFGLVDDAPRDAFL